MFTTLGQNLLRGMRLVSKGVVMIDYLYMFLFFMLLSLVLGGAWLTLEDRQQEFMKRQKERKNNTLFDVKGKDNE